MFATVKSSALDAITADEKVCRARRSFSENAENITARHIEICRIAAPPFGERKRAEHFLNRFREIGLLDARIDAEGNCTAFRKGSNSGNDAQILCISAHLDTVFAAETPFDLRREGDRIIAPGILDDGCGLAALLALAETLQTFDITTRDSILFVATVGEEGAGNLRGVRHLFERGEFADKINAFISLDGASVVPIVNRALGSRRYSVELRSVGGHSWIDFGAPNPIHAASRAIAKIVRFPIPKTPRVSFNIGKISGGTSVNSIPETAAFEVDLRSESESVLSKLDLYFQRCVTEAIAEENAARRKNFAELESKIELIGARPGGATDENSTLVRLAIEATQAVGITPKLTISSTDANLPMSLKIPSITIGAGGDGDKMHTLNEWYDPNGREIGLERMLLLTLVFVGIA
ncbi:MAG: M20/M25/M40 family metallo-hydrolase [Pyrinomonadaceae bacterium]|nr:M20/M25/M40 family metallo-hydrolase [Pyrinomonadaceae bacterium]